MEPCGDPCVLGMRVVHGLSVLIIGEAGKPQGVTQVVGNTEVVCHISKIEEWLFLQKSFSVCWPCLHSLG